MKTLARQQDTIELLRRLRALHPDSVRRWGRMSVHQMVCHLADSFRMATGERSVTLRASLIERTIMKWMALYAPVRWPPGILTSAEIDPLRGGTQPGDFAADVARLEELMNRVAAQATGLDRQVHPVFGRMSSAGWLRWGYLHTDHHLRQFGA